MILTYQKKSEICSLLIQQLYYLKQFEIHGEILPNILFGADKDECFSMNTNKIINYLRDENIDWDIPASEASIKNPKLLKKMIEDKNISPFIFTINNNDFNFVNVVDNIKKLNNEDSRKVKITSKNIERYFLYFVDKIITKSKKYSADELVAIFMGCLIDKQNNYPHPRKINCLVTSALNKNMIKEISINRNIFDSFFEHFETKYLIKEKKNLTSISDRLITDLSRRFHGEFYTPVEWTNEAHRFIENKFGLDWKEKYVVWDPAWGTGNLTRDYKFKELYCSTLNYSDLEIGKNYNPEAMKFQYDFLNDDIIESGTLPIDGLKLPDSLVQAFKENKPIIILMNPPFGKSTGGRYGIETKNSNKNKIKKLMYNKYSLNVQNFVFQFLFRIKLEKINHNLSNINICTFQPLSLISSSYYAKTRRLIFDDFRINDIFIFDSSYFSNTSKIKWPCAFSIYNVGKESRDEILITVKEKDEYGKIYNQQNKNLVLYDSNNSIKWLKKGVDKSELKEGLIQRSSLILFEDEGYDLVQKKYVKNQIGSLFCNGSYVRNNGNELNIFSGIPHYAQILITTENFLNVVAYYTARKTTILNLTNMFDEYLIPNTNHVDYQQWNNDAIIYSLFQGQSAIKNIRYKNRTWSIKNEWFWMSNQEMMELAEKYDFDKLYYDAQDDINSFVYNKLKNIKLSEDARCILDKAKELVIKSFPMRKIVYEENILPKHLEKRKNVNINNNLHAWDAGWYQIKIILNRYFKDDLKEFKLMYKKFEKRMEEGVYKFGFLK